MQINKQKIFFAAIILVLAGTSIYLGANWVKTADKLDADELTIATQRQNKKILQFTDLFIEKVLRAENEVSFEDRLRLENAVRDLNDEEILIQWEKFTGSKTEQEAQEEVKNLLQLLIKKVPT